MSLVFSFNSLPHCYQKAYPSNQYEGIRVSWTDYCQCFGQLPEIPPIPFPLGNVNGAMMLPRQSLKVLLSWNPARKRLYKSFHLSPFVSLNPGSCQYYRNMSDKVGKRLSELLSPSFLYKCLPSIDRPALLSVISRI